MYCYKFDLPKLSLKMLMGNLKRPIEVKVSERKNKYIYYLSICCYDANEPESLQCLLR